MARPHGRPSQTVTPTLKKRTASPNTTPRASKRTRSSTGATPMTGHKATPKQSKYFEPPTESDTATDDDADDTASAFGESSATETEDEDDDNEDQDEDEDNSEDDGRRRGRGRGKGAKKPTVKRVALSTLQGGQSQTGGELWREGLKVDAAPGQEVFIELPKARAPGKIAYRDDAIHPHTFLFLADLKRHNERSWLKMHDADFRQAENDFKAFVEVLTDRLTEIDETVPALPVKDVIFRIYRDVRFSKDPTPYKPYFSVAFSRTGRKGPYAHYYVQFAPNNASLVAGGIWMPESQPLAVLRDEVDHDAPRLKTALMDGRVRQHFLGGAPAQWSKVKEAFAKVNKESALKTKPMNYEADNPNIQLLRLRNYTLVRKLKDDEVIGPKGLDRITESLEALVPFITQLNAVVMPDD